MRSEAEVITAPEPTTPVTPTATTATAVSPTEGTHTERLADLPIPSTAEVEAENSSKDAPASPAKAGILNRFTKRFSRRASKPAQPDADVVDSKGKGKDTSSSFVGGAALTGASASQTSLGPSSAREVAVASTVEPDNDVSDVTADDAPMMANGTDRHGRNSLGQEAEVEERSGRGRKRVDSISSVSSQSLDDGTEDEFEEARDRFDEDAVAAPTLGLSSGADVREGKSPVRDSKFTEVI